MVIIIIISKVSDQNRKVCHDHGTCNYSFLIVSLMITENETSKSIPLCCFASVAVRDDSKGVTLGGEGSILLNTGLGSLQPAPV